MKKLFVVTVSALVAASAFAPAAQAKHRKKMMMAPAPMMAPAGNPRMNAQGQFYATPVGGMSPMGMMMAPLAAPGQVAVGAADLGLGAAGTGLDVLTAPLK